MLPYDERIDQAQKHLAFLFPGGGTQPSSCIAISYARPKADNASKTVLQTQTFPANASGLLRAASFSVEQALQDYNVYVAISLLVNAPNRGSRGAASDADGTFVRLVDIDQPKNGSPRFDPKQLANTLCDRSNNQRDSIPSGVVESGHGLHVYWRSLFTNDASVVASQAQRLRHYVPIRADEAVGASMAQLVRVAGTINFKHPNEPVDVLINYLDRTHDAHPLLDDRLPIAKLTFAPDGGPSGPEASRAGR